MRIVHLALQAPYNEGWGYQENLLLKYQRKQGHSVALIVTNTKNTPNGIVNTDCGDYYLNDGQHIFRVDYIHFRPRKLAGFIQIYRIYKILVRLRPDLIMVHGLGNISVLQIVKYLKKINSECKIIADNHLDYYNFPQERNSIKYRIRHIMHVLLNLYMQKYYIKVYGVTPERITFQKDYFNIKAEKCDLLVMGGDDDKIHFEQQKKIRNYIRHQFQLKDSDFVIVTGGKIDYSKNVLLLMQAIRDCRDSRIKLLIFGAPNNEIADEFEKMAENDAIRLAGWINGDAVYDFFLASDLGVFPGTHSVLWEQACASGLPCVFKDLRGMHHVDVGGNCRFIKGDTSDEIKNTIQGIYENVGDYMRMKCVATTKGVKIFSYNEIAKKVMGSLK